VEAANVRDVASAEKLALAAYQAGDWEGAQRWIDRARTSPVSQWLQAKLFLRAGKTDVLIGYWNTSFTHVPILMATGQKKRLSPDCDLWLNVLAATGQPPKMI